MLLASSVYTMTGQAEAGAKNDTVPEQPESKLVRNVTSRLGKHAQGFIRCSLFKLLGIFADV